MKRPLATKRTRERKVKAVTVADAVRLMVPDDFLYPRDESARQVDMLVYKLLYMRHALGRPEDAPAAIDFVRRLHVASLPREVEPLDLVEKVLYLADADPVMVSGHPASLLRDARVILARHEIAMNAPGAKVSDAMLRAAMWPERGKTKPARAALARALGWTGVDKSLHVRLAQRKGAQRKG